MGSFGGVKFVCFVTLRPKATAMVMAGLSVPNHTFSWASLNKQLSSTSCTYFRLQQSFLNDSTDGRRMTVEIIS